MEGGRAEFALGAMLGAAVGASTEPVIGGVGFILLPPLLRSLPAPLEQPIRASLGVPELETRAGFVPLS